MYKSDEDLTDQTLATNTLAAFPGYLNQEDGSNNQSLLDIIAQLSIQYKNSLLSISDQVLIDNATGQTLTDLASDYSVTRIDNDDDFLRFQLKVAILRMHLSTTMNGFKSLISTVLNLNPASFDIEPGNTIESVIINNLPYAFSDTRRELKEKILTSYLESMLPVEYNLEEIRWVALSSTNIYLITVPRVHFQTSSTIINQ